MHRLQVISNAVNYCEKQSSVKFEYIAVNDNFILILIPSKKVKQERNNSNKTGMAYIRLIPFNENQQQKTSNPLPLPPVSAKC